MTRHDMAGEGDRTVVPPKSTPRELPSPAHAVRRHLASAADALSAAGLQEPRQPVQTPRASNIDIFSAAAYAEPGFVT